MMANDPLSMLATQMNTAFSDIGRGLNQVNAEFAGQLSQVSATLNQMAPHNVIAQMGQGSGTFSGKMSTQDLDQRNIFGGGGA